MSCLWFLLNTEAWTKHSYPLHHLGSASVVIICQKQGVRRSRNNVGCEDWRFASGGVGEVLLLPSSRRLLVCSPNTADKRLQSSVHNPRRSTHEGVMLSLTHNTGASAGLLKRLSLSPAYVRFTERLDGCLQKKKKTQIIRTQRRSWVMIWTALAHRGGGQWKTFRADQRSEQPLPSELW